MKQALPLDADVSKYFAIIPAAFASTYPVLDRLNMMQLSTPESAIMSAVIFIWHQADRSAANRDRMGIAMRQQLRPALVVLGLLTLITGVLYLLAVTVVAQVVFPDQANGSLIKRDGRIIGSELIGQSFDDPRYFGGRLFATRLTPYNAAVFAGTYDGPLSPALTARAQERIETLRAADPGITGPIPVDLATASASGLDPHISPAAAYVQVPRVARSRGLDEMVVRALVADHIEERQFGIFGESRVNVLKLNLALDDLVP